MHPNQTYNIMRSPILFFMEAGNKIAKDKNEKNFP